MDTVIKSVPEAAETRGRDSGTAGVLSVDIEAKTRPYVPRGGAWLCKLSLLRFS